MQIMRKTKQPNGHATYTLWQSRKSMRTLRRTIGQTGGRGMFIVFEGGEGSGKSTAAYEFWKRLKRWKENAILTREPGGTEVAEQIRGILLQTAEEELDIRTEVLLFAAARRQHLIHKIIPALESGQTVICDRFIDSSVVHQGQNQHSGGIEKVREINSYIDANLKPDITFLFDIDPAVGLERIRANKREANRFDEKELAYHENIRSTYRYLAAQDYSYVIIDADQSVGDVLQDVLEQYEARRLRK